MTVVNNNKLDPETVLIIHYAVTGILETSPGIG